GISREDIGVTSQQYAGGDDSYGDGDKHEGVGDKIGNFFSSLFGGDDDASHYTDAVRRGQMVVTVDCESEDQADRVVAILDRFDADVDERGASHEGDRGTAYAATSRTDYEETNVDTARLREGGEATLPVMEEELQVGKRQVERGGVRVRSRVIERPVEEVVRLREERVNVERRPVNRAVTDGDLQAFREGTFEVTERAEEAVVNKQARVVEEVAINKEVGERTETVRDTVRKTDVDVEEVDSTTKRTRGAGGNR
ncbi:MAG TPA: YsnF/AvaK domain-containing protein, partial [Pyrinomonadaceae bacterium]|nr:YsnF/AvaK domain-containing protein [Pyrinomonadaceae bacterium]